MPESIDEVIAELDSIIEQAIRQGSPMGYFPALYRRVTVAVKVAIEKGAFEDNPRMERLDVVFANRYLDAHRSFTEKKPLTASWKTAFQLAANPSLITLQHLLLGMNAHISLDLGIAAATVSDRDRPLSLKPDFHTINTILESLIDDTQARLTRIFGPLGLCDRLLGSIDETLSIYSIAYARDKAWTQTLELIPASPLERENLIAERDRAVAGFAQHLAHPHKVSIRLLVRLIRLLEKGNVAQRIDILHAP